MKFYVILEEILEIFFSKHPMSFCVALGSLAAPFLAVQQPNQGIKMSEH